VGYLEGGLLNVQSETSRGGTLGTATSWETNGALTGDGLVV